MRGEEVHLIPESFLSRQVGALYSIKPYMSNIAAPQASIQHWLNRRGVIGAILAQLYVVALTLRCFARIVTIAIVRLKQLLDLFYYRFYYYI